MDRTGTILNSTGHLYVGHVGVYIPFIPSFYSSSLLSDVLSIRCLSDPWYVNRDSKNLRFRFSLSFCQDSKNSPRSGRRNLPSCCLCLFTPIRTKPKFFLEFIEEFSSFLIVHTRIPRVGPRLYMETSMNCDGPSTRYYETSGSPWTGVSGGSGDRLLGGTDMEEGSLSHTNIVTHLPPRFSSNTNSTLPRLQTPGPWPTPTSHSQTRLWLLFVRDLSVRTVSRSTYDTYRPPYLTVNTVMTRYRPYTRSRETMCNPWVSHWPGVSGTLEVWQDCCPSFRGRRDSRDVQVETKHLLIYCKLFSGTYSPP